jgi:hypothetical protein
MSRKLLRILSLVGLGLIVFGLSIILGRISFAQVIRTPAPEPFPSISPPVQCVPDAVQKASWLLPTPTNNILWKNLQSSGVSVWVPYRYQLRNNFQAQQLDPLPPGTVVFRSDDRLGAIDPTGTSSQPDLIISKQRNFRSRSAAESYVKELLDGTVNALSDPSLREQGANISVNRQRVSFANYTADRLIMDIDVTEAARRQQQQVSMTRRKLGLYFPIDGQNTLWAIQFSASPEDFNNRFSEFEKIACTFTPR